MRKIILILFVAMLALTGTTYAEDTPKDVVGKYLEAVRNNQYDKAYSYISYDDTTIIDWLELIKYIKEIAPPELTEVVHHAHSATKQRIVNTSVNGNTALVEILSIVPNIGEALKVTNDPKDLKFLLEHGGLPTRERLGECELVMEDGVWKISRIRGVSSGQAAKIAIDFANLILEKDKAKALSKKIDDFMRKQDQGV